MNIKQLKERWKGWNEKRFLANYGCNSWREYERKYDVDFASSTRHVNNAYHGYPYISHYPNSNRSHGPFTYVIGHIDQQMEWCEKNCKGKWRNDWFRGNWDTNDNFACDEVSGGDFMFFAFKEEADYIWFKLVWE